MSHTLDLRHRRQPSLRETHKQANLMVLEPDVLQGTIVRRDAPLEILNAGLVLEAQVTLDEAPVELDDLAQGEMLARGAVESAAGLDELSTDQERNEGVLGEAHHERLVIRRDDSDSPQSIIYHLQEFRTRDPLIIPSPKVPPCLTLSITF